MAGYPNDPLWRRHLAEIVVVGIGLVLVVGLWLDNRNDGLAPRAAATTSTTAVAAATSTTAAAAEPGEQTTAVPEPEPVSSGDGAGELVDAVLRVSDLPGGWTKASISAAPGVLCAGFDPFGDARAVANVRAAFSADAGARLMGASVASFRGTTQASSFLERLRDAARGCARTGGTFVVATLPNVGDEAVGVTFSVSNGPTTTHGVVYLARKGQRTAVITSTADNVDEALALRALRAEVSRL